MQARTIVTEESETRCLPWHAEAWQQLQSRYAEGRLPHALLLEGLPGTGRNMLALSLARQLLCAQPTPAGNCGKCKGCVLSASGAHADLMRVVPEEAGKAIGIDAVRGAIRFAASTASQGASKVILLSPAEAMTMAANNAFLKCLEEPAAGTYIMLVCARGFPLPATIRSRCQRVTLEVPTTEQARGWLSAAMEEGGLAATGDATPDELLTVHEGRPLQALARLQQGESGGALDLWRAVTGALAGENAARTQVEKAVGNVDAAEFLHLVELALRQWLRNQGAGDLRSGRGHAAFAALTLINQLRTADRSGTNPNPDLLKFRVLRAVSALWR